MDKAKFSQHLDEATNRLIDLTKTHCYNELSGNFNYLITPNSRAVAKGDAHLNEKEIAVLKTWNKYEGRLLTANEVVELLHHDNTVPVWINATVYEAKPDVTVIDLHCSRRLREEKELMHQGLHPFHPQVITPVDYLVYEFEDKFDVNWKMEQDKRKPRGILTRLKQLFR